MKKYIKYILLFFVFVSTIVVGYSSWIIANNQLNHNVIIPNVGRSICYNKQTNKKYMNLNKALAEVKEFQDIYIRPGTYITLNNNITIPKNVSLIMPYSGETYNITSDAEIVQASSIGDSNQTQVTNNRKSLINLRNGADIIVNGTLTIGAIFSAYGVHSSYCEINLGLNSSITVNGTLNCYGYIKENYEDAKNGSQPLYSSYRYNEYDSERKVLLNTNARLNSTLAIFDLKSGGPLDKLNTNGVCPFNHLNFTNIQTFLEIYKGATYNVESHLQISGNNTIQKMNIVTYSTNNEPSLYYIKSGKIGLEYVPLNLRYTSRSDKLRIYLDGEIDQGYLEIKKSFITIRTSDYFLPLSEYFNIFINTGSIFNTSYRLKLLPGTSLTIEKGATFNLNSELVSYDKDVANITSISNDSTCSHLLNKPSALFINNGNLNINANSRIGAEINTKSIDGSAKIVFDINCITNVNSPEGTTGTIVNIVSIGYFYNENDPNKKVLSQFVKGTTVSSDINGNCCWVGQNLSIVTLKITIDSTNPNAVCNYRIFVADDQNGLNQTELTTQIMQSSGSYEVIKNKYFKIDLSDFSSAKFTVFPIDSSEIFTTNTWYHANDSYELFIIPNESVDIVFTTNSFSGAGGTTFTLLVSDTKDGQYVNIGSQSGGKGNFKIGKNKWFKVTSKIGQHNPLQYPKGVEFKSKTISKGPSSLLNTQLNETIAYQASESYQIDYIIGEKTSGGGCLIKGDKVMLSDGTYKNVETLNINDKITSFNHYTGKLEKSHILSIINHGKKNWNVMNLYFDNNKNISIAENHDIFNIDRKTYLTVNKDNIYNYIGERFAFIIGNNVEYAKLTNVEVQIKEVEAYTIISDKNLNCISNGLLNSISFLNSYFKFNDDLTYDKNDINESVAKYGIYTYDEVSNRINYKLFMGSNFKYFKIMIGKGLMSEEFLFDNLKLFEQWYENGDLIINEALYNDLI